MDFSFLFAKARAYIPRLSEEDGSAEPRKLQESHREWKRDASLSPDLRGEKKGKGEMSAASAAIPARDLTFTVTQGNQLRNKLSFYRILNRVLPSGRDVEI